MNAPGDRRPRICFVTAVPMSVATFLHNHLCALQPYADISVVSDFTLQAIDLPAGVQRLQAEIPRAIRPAGDVRALLQLSRLFARERFDVVHSVTPKAGLLGMTAARLCRVPIRIHWFTGQVWATRRGAMRRLLRAADRAIDASATHMLVDSVSQRDFLRAEGVLSATRGVVIGDGSITGVDVERFRPDPDVRARMRTQMGIAPSDFVVLYVGRLNRDKGVLDLARAFAGSASRCPNMHLWLAGPDEEDMGAQIRRICAAVGGRVHIDGYTYRPQEPMATADLLCLPSYREGFGSVIVEAAACGIPALGSRIYGLTDAIEDRVTGRLYAAGQVDELAAALVDLYAGVEERLAMGSAARRRALEKFSSARVTQGLVDFYRSIGALP